MERIVGIAASEGYAIGRMYIHLEAAEDWSHQTALDPDQEVSRFQQAKEDACIELGTVYHRAVARVGEHHSGIFKIHLALLRDDDFCKEVSEYIQQNHCTAEKGVQEVGQKFFRIFEEMDDDYLRARGADVKDIVSRLLFFLGENRKEEMGDWLPKGAQGILAAEEIMPSQTIRMDVDQVTGLITRTGSRTSHSAILARSLQIPAVTGLGKQFDLLQDGSCVILDGFKGLVIQDPDEETLSAYQKLAQEYENQQKALESYKGMKAVTQDGTVVELCANIGHPNDLDEVLDNGADGVGLFRTEFLFMYWGRQPTEEEQFGAYRTVLEQMQGKRVVIRTLDIGADKQVPYLRMEREENPAMGRRSLRYCLENPKVFLTQLRALLRAARYGKLAILIPMVVSVEEVLTVRKLLQQAAAELEQEGVPFSRDYEFGVMIETPSAAMISDLLAPHVDFFSIGTNDLVQFTVAADRENPHVAALCDPQHPAVRRLIEIAVKNGVRSGIRVAVCGEAAADPAMTRFLLSIGVRELSVAPASLLEIRHTIQSLRLT